MSSFWATAAAGARAALAEAAATGKSLLSRSKALAAMAVLTAGANLGLPRLLDAGAPAGDRLRLLATYSFGTTGFLLTVFALWAGGAAVSSEAGAGTLGLSLTKPAGRWSLWLGKWLATAAACWGLLAVGAVAAGFGMWRLAREAEREGGGAALLRGAWETIRAESPDAEAETESRLAEWAAGKAGVAEALREGGPAAAEWREAARRSVLRERYTVGSGEEAVWRFRAGEGGGDGAAAVAWRAHATEPGVFRLTGELSAEGAGGTARVRMDGAAGVPQSAELGNWRAGAGEVTVRVRVEGEPGGTAFGFDPEEGMSLRIRRGGAAANFGKALLLLAARLALLAAVGTAFGTWFSTATAGFLSAAMVVLLGCSGILRDAAAVDRATFVGSLQASTTRVVERVGDDGETVAEERSMPTWVATAMWAAYRGTAAALGPLIGDRSAADACEGEWIPWRRVVGGSAVAGVAVPAALCALCAWSLRRREWGAVS